MTRYTVTATAQAEGDLAQLWISSHDRAALAAAADTIDQILREDAATKGCEATFGLRQLIVPPLVVEFVVEEEDRRVSIHSFRHIGELSNGH